MSLQPRKQKAWFQRLSNISLTLQSNNIYLLQVEPKPSDNGAMFLGEMRMTGILTTRPGCQLHEVWRTIRDKFTAAAGFTTWKQMWSGEDILHLQYPTATAVFSDYKLLRAEVLAYQQKIQLWYILSISSTEIGYIQSRWEPLHLLRDFWHLAKSFSRFFQNISTSTYQAYGTKQNLQHAKH